MAAKQQPHNLELAEKLMRVGYPVYAVRAGEEDIDMLYIEERFICSVDHALNVDDVELKALVDETVKVGLD